MYCFAGRKAGKDTLDESYKTHKAKHTKRKGEEISRPGTGEKVVPEDSADA